MIVRHFKQWPYKDEEENVEYEKRPEPITQLSRVASVFVRQKPSEAHTSDMTVTENDDNVIIAFLLPDVLRTVNGNEARQMS